MSQMPNYSVYLSSTFQDLEPYREAVIQFFTDYYTAFRIKGMENYSAFKEPPLDVCLAHVRASDIYILLLANRYGYIPENDKRNPERKSITELEYEEAVKYRKEILVFILDENVISIGDDDSDLLEYKQKKLIDFRRKALTNHTSPRPFRDPTRLVYGINASIFNWQNRNAHPKDKIYDEKAKYCCDRTQQFLLYRNHVYHHDSNFHVFISSGHREELGPNLVNRCAIFSLMMHEEDISYLTLNEIYKDDHAESRAQFLNQLIIKMPSLGQLFKNEPLSGSNGINDDSIFLLNTSAKFIDFKRIDFLLKMLNEIYQKCMSFKYPYKIYLFVNIEDEDENDGPVMDYVKNNVKVKGEHAYITILPRFTKITKDEVRNWIGVYIDKDAGIKEDIMDYHFNDLPQMFSMKEAEKKIRTLLRLISNKDSKIMTLLNISIS